MIYQHEMQSKHFLRAWKTQKDEEGEGRDFSGFLA